MEEAWEALNEDRGMCFTMCAIQMGKSWAGDMRILDFEYTVATVLHSQHVYYNSISQVEKSLKKLTYGAPHIFRRLEKTDIYLVASEVGRAETVFCFPNRSLMKEL